MKKVYNKWIKNYICYLTYIVSTNCVNDAQYG